MENQEYDALAAQIGDMGAEESTTQATQQSPKPQASLGKLKHKSSYGAKEDLTDSEKESLNAFLKKTSAPKKHSDDISDSAIIAEGWVPIDRKEMGIRERFYPESWEFFIRPATTQAIKNWLSVDESNLLQLNRVFNEIIKHCVKIVNGDTNVSWGNVNSWDRFWFTMKVRELTFASQKSAFSFEDTCSECDQDITFELRSSNLHYEFPDEELVDKYWDGTNWVIDPREYDVDHDELTLYTPTISKEVAIIEWARREHERGKKIDETFTNFALWMISKASKDDDMFDKQIKKVYNEYKKWDVAFFKFMLQVVNNITINPKETLKQNCPHCGEEVVSNVQFPNGVKVLFDVETGSKKFGSR